ncbi:MAG: N-acetylmuramoyl-L-alanine amidase, partial [Deltaproteobacteria bacterium]|nr:N-acetylmuramoyl-L-alanine amidase [Deltaproteobacteria bacterium]
GAPHKVVIDAGHGGENMGALGAYGIYEKAVTLSIAKKLEAMLMDDGGYNVFMTRSGDTYISLKDRAEIANELEADVFVSIHCNASAEKEPSGFETFFLSPDTNNPEDMKLAEIENTDIISKIETEELDRILNDLSREGTIILSEKLAGAVQGSLSKSLKAAADRGVRQAPFTVLKSSLVPAIVVEAGFITNQEEGLLLLMGDYQTKIAEGIYAGIKKYIKSRNVYSPPLH